MFHVCQCILTCLILHTQVAWEFKIIVQQVKMSVYYGPSDHSFRLQEYRVGNSDSMDKILNLMTKQTKQIVSLKDGREKLHCNCHLDERISQSLEEHSSTKATTQSAAKVPRYLSVSAGIYN